MSVRRTLAAALAAGVLLAGCSDEPEPTFEPPDSPSPSSGESESSSSEPEAQSPEEFIREWVELDRDMQTSGETRAYLAVSSRCGSCRDFADRVSDVYAAGGSIKTDGWRVRSISEEQASTYSLSVRSAPSSVIEREGAQPQKYEGGLATYELVLREVQGQWQIMDWYEVPT